MMSEIWKDIKGFNDYMISNMGFVLSKERVVDRKMSDVRILKRKINCKQEIF